MNFLIVKRKFLFLFTHQLYSYRNRNPGRVVIYNQFYSLELKSQNVVVYDDTILNETVITL